MADKLIIVESPAKATTIKKFLGGNVKVLASMGHIRDLPKSKLAIDIENDFTPEYINIRGKGALIKTLKKEAKNAKYVYLATDPDREGEAIAWHLAYILEIPEDEVCRVTFNEITKEAIQKSIKSPRKIDKDLTDAQQARRVLDRIVGYKISPILWKKVKRGLSAGRVQSVAVKLIVDREEEIEKFIPEEYWNITVQLLEPKTEKTFEANFYGKEGKKLELHSKEDVDNIIKQIEKGQYIVTDVKKGEKKRTPAPPFTTSTMQQEASRKLGFTLKRTMSIAQGLYEGVNVGAKGTVGLITYMRTDSTRISEEARAYAKEHIVKTYGENYYENRYYKTKQNSQDAHEAIRPTYAELEPESIKDSLKRLILPSVEREIRADLKEKAEITAIDNFSSNVEHLLLTPPIKEKVVLGYDPAFRTGCKLAVLDKTGKPLEIAVIYPTEPHNKIEESKKKVLELIDKYNVDVIAIGNGTASRESEAFIADTIKECKRKVEYIIVSEAGASVYSASKLATEEYPDINVSLRGAISIARRLQDPLAELVKIDPKSIGVGQYQHDVDQKKLSESLTGVVEDAVNKVGVDVNTATPSLLSYVSGINKTLASNIVKYRDENGKIKERKELLKVPKLGKATFQQCAGFMRVFDGKNPLEITGVHPEILCERFQVQTGDFP